MFTLTARRLFVGVVVAVFVPVAQLRLVYALGPLVRSALRAQVFARTSQSGAVQFVGAVLAVRVPVALVVQRDAESVAATELAHVTSGEVLKENEKNCFL